MKSNIRLFLLSIYQYISFHGLDDHIKIGRDKDYIIILNKYLFLVFLIFLIQGFATGLLLGFTLHVFFLWFTSCLTIGFGFYFKNVFKNKYVVSFSFIYLIIIVTYYSSITGVGSGCYLYYFSILTALPIFFSIKKDSRFLIFIGTILLICLNVSAFKNFTLWGLDAQSDYGAFHSQFLLLNINCQLMLLSVNYFVIEHKRNEYDNILNRNLLKREQIENLHVENIQLKELMDKKEISEEFLKDLLNTISVSDVVFLEKFQQAFPYFKKRLFDATTVQLTASELTLCAIARLGLSTKEIALHTGTSVKSVEGRKYRLRKKFNIPSDTDFALWFSKY